MMTVSGFLFGLGVLLAGADGPGLTWAQAGINLVGLGLCLFSLHVARRFS